MARSQKFLLCMVVVWLLAGLNNAEAALFASKPKRLGPEVNGLQLNMPLTLKEVIDIGNKAEYGNISVVIMAFNGDSIVGKMEIALADGGNIRVRNFEGVFANALKLEMHSDMKDANEALWGSIDSELKKHPQGYIRLTNWFSDDYMGSFEIIATRTTMKTPFYCRIFSFPMEAFGEFKGSPKERWDEFIMAMEKKFKFSKVADSAKDIENEEYAMLPCGARVTPQYLRFTAADMKGWNAFIVDYKPKTNAIRFQITPPWSEK